MANDAGHLKVVAIIQARMSSSRFPGKVLAPLRGRPLLAHTIKRVGCVLPLDRILIATSTDPTDDPVACYSQSLGVCVVRGPLHDVFERFSRCLREARCDWFFRVCADSPYPDPDLMRDYLERCQLDSWDLITNVFPRTFPKGRSLELVRASRFLELAEMSLTLEQREHVTKFFYDHAGRFRICNVTATGATPTDISYAVDEVADLRRLEVLPEP